MNSQDFVKLALQLTTMLGFAVLFGELLRRFKQPAVVGEMLGGIVLGPTIFGWLAPSVYEWLFLSSANVTTIRDAVTKLGMLFFLFYAGLEVNLSDLKTLGRKAVLIGLIGTVLPILAGVWLAASVLGAGSSSALLLVRPLRRDEPGQLRQSRHRQDSDGPRSAHPVDRCVDHERHDRRRPRQLDAVRDDPRGHRPVERRGTP